MWEPSRCCCFSLRTGSLIVASLKIGFGILSIICINPLVKNDSYKKVHKFCKDNSLMICEPGAIDWISAVFAISCIKVCFSILLVHGIRKNMTRLMAPYMIMEWLSIFLLIWITPGLPVILVGRSYVQYALAAGVILGGITFLETYFLLVVWALALELEREKGQAHMTSKEDVDIPLTA